MFELFFWLRLVNAYNIKIKFILVTLLLIRVFGLLSVLAFVGQYNIFFLEIEKDLHHWIFIILKYDRVIQDLLIICITSETIYCRHVDSGFLFVEINIVCIYLRVLGEYYNSFISQDQLALLLLTFWGYDWNIVPYNIFVEMLLNENDLLMQRH